MATAHEVTKTNAQDRFYFHVEQACRLEATKDSAILAIQREHARLALVAAALEPPENVNPPRVENTRRIMASLVAGGNHWLREYLSWRTNTSDLKVQAKVKGRRRELVARFGLEAVCKAETLYGEDKNVFNDCESDAAIVALAENWSVAGYAKY
jgi:hypothetical protein